MLHQHPVDVLHRQSVVQVQLHPVRGDVHGRDPRTHAHQKLAQKPQQLVQALLLRQDRRLPRDASRVTRNARAVM